MDGLQSVKRAALVNVKGSKLLGAQPSVQSPGQALSRLFPDAAEPGLELGSVPPCACVIHLTASVLICFRTVQTTDVMM